MKNAPYIITAAALVAFIALLALPWVASDGESITMLEIIRSHAHGYQVGYAILAPLVVASAVGALSIKKSARWMTVITSVLLIIPTFLAAVAHDAALGAHIAAALSAVALISAIALTVKPNRGVA